MKRYQRVPTEIDAIQLTDGNLAELRALCEEHEQLAVLVETELAGRAVREHVVGIEVQTYEGTMRGDAGDWLLRGVEGEFYCCKDSVFQKIYREAV